MTTLDFSIKLPTFWPSHCLSTFSPKAAGKIMSLLINLTGHCGRKDEMRCEVVKPKSVPNCCSHWADVVCFFGKKNRKHRSHDSDLNLWTWIYFWPITEKVIYLCFVNNSLGIYQAPYSVKMINKYLLDSTLIGKLDSLRLGCSNFLLIFP